MDQNWRAERIAKYKEFWQIPDDQAAWATAAAEATDEAIVQKADGLAPYNIEWHWVPSDDELPFDEEYAKRMYPQALHQYTQAAREHRMDDLEHVKEGHQRHQGRVIGVETTIKPRYLPNNHQFYGTFYGFDQGADPLALYMGRAGMVSGTRYAHNYPALVNFLKVLGADWEARQMLPAGYRVGVCPPAIFNLVGAVFHPEWSETESLELGFYSDADGNATCFAVGCNGPRDFSYLNKVEGEADWSLLGFRLALLPDS